jgi:EAL and modified HD-GYP domain-containing signal transduction protein
VVARTLGELGVAAVLGAYPGYVNISGELLLDDIVHIMPPDRFVLEILETVSFDAALAKRCEQLRRNGFRLALDDVAAISVNLLAALPYVDVVKIDLVQAKHDDLPALVELVKSGRKRLVAEKVETHADFQLALDLGCDLFQGYFFARPQVLTSRHTGSSRLALMRLLAVLASDPDIGELETQLKLNPKLVMQLLRLVNSSAVGLSQKISSVRAAIIAIGTRQIARWAQLLLFADGRTLPLHADPLVQLAGTRAHCMEMMAHRLRPEEEFFGAAAFMAGLFSLIDVVFGEPLEHILDQLTLAPEIRGAIVAREGLLGKLLNLCEASERGDIATLDTEDPELAALSPTVLAELGIAAAAWFDRQIGQY